MTASHREVAPGLNPRTVRSEAGQEPVPAGWDWLAPGDGTLTRRVKAEGPCWVVVERRGRKRFVRGLWAPGERIERLRAELLAERQDPAYERRLAAGRARREREQEAYVEDFRGAVLEFLDFAPVHAALAAELATAIAAHATPVGSGTVARTERIPVAERAAAATIAWLRHRTTAYDHMHILRVAGRRREVRRALAQESMRLLAKYRRGESVAADCLLRRALDRATSTT